MLKFQNYHRHSYYTNVRVPDSVVSNEDYAKRAVELGHGIICPMEHGFQGRNIEGYELARKCFNYDKDSEKCKKCGGKCGGCENSTKPLKFVFGAEAYWVKDRLESDRSNCHICIFAKNESGRQAINDILAEANITGFYHQPRIDIPLIMSLPSRDVIVSSACVGYWKYEDIDEITLQFHKKFKENFYLEVQYHNTEKQKDLNRHILFLSEEHKIPLIMGCDSHYIYEDQAQGRKDYLASKGMIYPDEEGWYMDYPDGDEAYRRFEKQGILPHSKIIEAMENTNIFLSVEEYDSPVFTKDIKMPTLHPSLSQNEKDQLYENLVWKKWNEYKKEISEAHWSHYEKEIQSEINIVKVTKHADYFLVDHEIIKKGKELGGVITSTGRGSGVSFITNKLLGFTDVDRVAARVKMYPERFMSSTRIIEAKTLAD